MWYCLLLSSILLIIKLIDQSLFFSITRISHTDIPSTKKIDAPPENMKSQDVIAFVFRGGIWVFFLHNFGSKWLIMTTLLFMGYFVWLGYTFKFVLEMMIGLLAFKALASK